MELSDIYVREKDKMDARIRNLEQRYKIIENDNLVLRQRLAVVEDKFRQEPGPIGEVTPPREYLDAAICDITDHDSEHSGSDIKILDVETGKITPLKKTRAKRKGTTA